MQNFKTLSVTIHEHHVPKCLLLNMGAMNTPHNNICQNYNFYISINNPKHFGSLGWGIP